MVSSQARREQVAFACERGLSQRRACELLEVARSALTSASVRAERDAPALEAMKRLAAQYPRYGYRRIRIFLRREGIHMSRHRAHRLWRLAALQLPVTTGGAGAWRVPGRGRSRPSTICLRPCEMQRRRRELRCASCI